MRVFALAVDLFHDAVDFRHGQVRSAGEAHEDGVGLGEHLAAFEKRVGQNFLHHFVGAIFARGLNRRQRTFLMPPAQHGAKVVEIHVDQAGVAQQPPDAAHALGEQFVGDLQRFVDAGVLIDQLENLLIRQTNDAVRLAFQLAQAKLRLALAARTFKIKRQRHNPQHQGAAFMRQARNDRPRARTGAATQARDNADDVRARGEQPDLIDVLLGGGAAHFGITARAEAAGELIAQG